MVLSQPLTGDDRTLRMTTDLHKEQKVHFQRGQRKGTGLGHGEKTEGVRVLGSKFNVVGDPLTLGSLEGEQHSSEGLTSFILKEDLTGC